VKVNVETFGKEAPKWSKELYAVVDIIGHRYQLIDEDSVELDRLYKDNEMQIVDVTKLIRPKPKPKGETYKQKVAVLKKQDTSEKKFKREGLEEANVVEGKRVRKQAVR
jgi:hypothetical protein